jgi:hypothetical protein
VRRSGLVGIACIAMALFGPAMASATTITLQFDVARDPANFYPGAIAPDGSIAYGIVRGTQNQVFLAEVTADDGSRVTGCLMTGAFELVDLPGRVYGTSKCADPVSGLFTFVLPPELAIDRPSELYARLTASDTTDAAQDLSVVNSNFAVMYVEPRIFDESPLRVRGDRYAIRVRVGVPSPRPEKGRVVLQRRQGTAWVTVGGKELTASGRYARVVALTQPLNAFRILFVPRVEGWLRAEVRFTIRRPKRAPSPTR